MNYWNCLSMESLNQKNKNSRQENIASLKTLVTTRQIFQLFFSEK